MGDSPVRELVSNLMMQFWRVDTSKFQHVDFLLNANHSWANHDLRVTYEFFHQMLSMDLAQPRDFNKDKELFDHFNFITMNSKPVPERGAGMQEILFLFLGLVSFFSYLFFFFLFCFFYIELAKTETTQPDIFVFNPCLIFSIYKQTFADFKAWMASLKQYIGDSIKNNKKMRVLWFGGPFVHAPPHDRDRKEVITSARMVEYNNYATQIIRGLGIEVVDLLTPTWSRYDNSWDGVHYSRAGGGMWVGSVSYMNAQIVLNVAFGTCDVSPSH